MQVTNTGRESNRLLSPPSQPTSGSKKGGKGGGGASPVVATRARRGNIPVYFSTIGSVTPIYTTVLQSRVVGELMNVNYKEGDMVKKGDLLMEIDPRPFQVQLEQAEAQLAKDQAVAQQRARDQARYKTLLKQNAIPEQTEATQEALVDQDMGTVKTDQAHHQQRQAEPGVLQDHGADHRHGSGCAWWTPETSSDHHQPLVVITQIQPISVHLPALRRPASAGLPKDARRPAVERRRVESRQHAEAGHGKVDHHR